MSSPLPVVRDRRHPLIALLVLLTAAALAPPAAALDSLADPVLPSIAAQGGSSVATAEGYEAFFSNPAGFRARTETTLLSLNPWLEGSLDWAEGVEDALLARASDEGLRIGGFTGIAHAGRGLGLGLFFSGGAEIHGGSELGGEARFQLGLAAGYSYGFSLFGLNVALGTALRPLLRVEVPLDDAAARGVIHASALGAWPLFRELWLEDALYAAGLAVDLGVIVDAGRLRVGAALTDVGGTVFRYSGARFGDVVSQVASFQGVPDGGSADESDTLPMLLRVGAAYRISTALQVHFEVRDPFGILAGEADLSDRFHAGLEVSPGAQVGLWFGLAGTRLSAGAGWRLGPLQTSLAAYGLDLREASASEIGIALETAIRF